MERHLADDATLVRFLALLSRVLVDARFRAYQTDPQLADLLDAIHSIPDLLTRWNDARPEWIVAELERYERQFGLLGRPYTSIIENGPPSTWQQRWLPPQSDVDPA
jgi:hypothetical protein